MNDTYSLGRPGESGLQVDDAVCLRREEWCKSSISEFLSRLVLPRWVPPALRDPSHCVGEPPIPEHPNDFTSTIIAGELTDARYEDGPTKQAKVP